MIFTIIFCVLTMAGGVGAIRSSKDFVATYGLARKDMAEMSWCAKEILKEYNALPATNRPGVDILAVVRALDFKLGISNLDDHFGRLGRNDTIINCWSECRCRQCFAHEYYELHESMQAITKAIGDQQYRLAIAGHTHGFEEAQDLLERLKSEAGLIQEVTEHLTGTKELL